MKQNEFDQKEFGFCKTILNQKKYEIQNLNGFNMKEMSQINEENFKNKQFIKYNVIKNCSSFLILII